MKTTQYPFLILLSLSLLGCAQTHQAFRNREFNYLHTTVTQRPALKIPPGLDKLKFTPALTVPEGQNTFTPEDKVNLLPPGIHAMIKPTEKHKAVATTGLNNKNPGKTL